MMGQKRGIDINLYIQCADQGMSKLEAANHIGVSVQCVHAMSKKYAIQYTDGRRRPKVQSNYSGESHDH